MRIVTMTDPPTMPTPDSDSAPPAGPLPATMRAVTRSRYGDESVLSVADVALPPVGADTVLVEVQAATINPLDWHMMTGTPWLVRLGRGLRRPKGTGIGADLAGRVAAVGDDVTDFKAGDEVVGVGENTLAVYSRTTPDKLVGKPANVSWHDAAGIGVAALTALQGLRDHAPLEAGQRVLINGAAGGVGTAAVQIAKWMGAEVTAVCSTRNVELMRELGADHVVDYTIADFTDTTTRYHVLFDNQGNRPLGAMKRIIEPGGTYLVVGGPKKNRALGPILRMASSLIRFRVGPRRAKAFMATEQADDMLVLADLMRWGDLRTVIDSVRPLDEAAAAMADLAAGHARGKIVIDTTTG